MSKKNKSLAGKITFIIFFLIVLGFSGLVYIDDKLSVNKVCAVVSAEYAPEPGGGSAGPVPSSTIVVRTEECGTLSIPKVESPMGMNEAALMEFLNDNRGKKFEFDVNGISLWNDVRGSSGITSTTPVE